jgi:hypothetical protein
MPDATQEELDHVLGYMASQAPDLTVEFAQKVYAENVLDHRHDVWDVHTNVDRWWVITNPTNLYSQAQFPNMDLAVTFHVGLCLRIPRSGKPKLADLPIEPFAQCYRYLSEAADALASAGSYGLPGHRRAMREALLAFVGAAQTVLPWTSDSEPPKRADFKAWVEHICNVSLAGSSQKDRRQLCKTLLNSAWAFSNWLTHTKSSKWHDAEAAASTTEHAVALCISAAIQHIRGVPDACPACGSHGLSPERAWDPETRIMDGSGQPAQNATGPASQCRFTGSRSRYLTRTVPLLIANASCRQCHYGGWKSPGAGPDRILEISRQ